MSKHVRNTGSTLPLPKDIRHFIVQNIDPTGIFIFLADPEYPDQQVAMTNRKVIKTSRISFPTIGQDLWAKLQDETREGRLPRAVKVYSSRPES